MKPVVSSLIALAIAIAPLSVMAKPAHHHKATHAKVVKHNKVDKSDKADKADKDKEAAPPVVRVKAGKSDHNSNNKKSGAIKPALHHAHNVDLGGAGHKEPKVDPAEKKESSGGGGAIVPASMTSKASHSSTSSGSKTTITTTVHAKPAKPSEMPKLPHPNAGKPSKGGAEKGAARKPAEKKHEASSDANDGEPARDEEFAELVARIRGHHDAGTSTHPVPSDDSSNNSKNAKNASVPRPEKAAHTETTPKPPPCVKEPVEIVRGPEVERFELTKCDGSIAPLAVEHLSILIRPGGAARPTAPLAELAKKPGAEIAQGIRRVDPRLVERIQSVVDHFSKPNAPAKIFVISGYRPMSVGSMHSTGRAIDFRVEGAKNEDVVSFCKTLGDTGCGFYPNSSFVHVDVRDPGAGHVSWIDASGPGETPRYVSTWPPPPVASRHIQKAKAADSDDAGESLLRRRPLDREAAPEAIDEHPADVAQ